MNRLRSTLLYCCLTSYLASQLPQSGSTSCRAKTLNCWSCFYQRHCSMSVTSSSQKTLLRLGPVSGIDDKVTDVVFCADLSTSHVGDVVFFGGDVQDYPEMMAAHRDNKRYIEWNVENTANLLSDRFPQHRIWLIKPDRMHLKTFSVYSSFVQSSDIGCPTHSPGQKSWSQLVTILKNAKIQSQELTGGWKVDSECDMLVLVSFSKGCVVLNQLLYDLDAARTDDDLSGFVNRVKAMYWLDGGHNGGSNIWINPEEVLRSLVGLDIEIFSHVTPYQIKDPMRKWIGREQKRFVKKLESLNVKITNIVHFTEDERSIENHFGVLKVF